MKNQYFKSHHWVKLSEILTKDAQTVRGLESFLKLGLLLKTEKLRDVHEQANQEYNMRIRIEEMRE